MVSQLQAGHQEQRFLQCIEAGCNVAYPIAPINECAWVHGLQPGYHPANRGIALRNEILEGPQNLYRYAPFLPTQRHFQQDIGLTELVRADELARAIGIAPGKLYLKMDEGDLTGTFKDRGAAVAAQCVAEWNESGLYTFRFLGATSTGNLASATPAAANVIGLKSIVMVHSNAEQELVEKASSFGAYVLRAGGDYSYINAMVNRLRQQNETIANSIGWVNITLRPVYSQGSKTIGFEVAEQLGWKAPDNIFYPVAAGLSLWQIYKGLQEFLQFGLIPEMQTRMHAAQPAGKEGHPADPVVRAWNAWVRGGRTGDFHIEPLKDPQSIAETLCVGVPANGYTVLEAIRDSNGSATSVPEDEIGLGMELVLQHTGWKTGPVGGVVVAAAKRRVQQGEISPDELTVLVLTDAHSGRNDYAAARGVNKGKIIEVGRRDSEVEATLEAILAGRL